MSKPRVALAAALPLLASGLPIFEGVRLIHGAMSRYGLDQQTFRLSREFEGRIRDPGEFWLGVGLVVAGVLSVLGVLWLARAAARQAPVSAQQPS